MDATPSNYAPRGGHTPISGLPAGDHAADGDLAAKWSILHDAAAAVGVLADLPAEPLRPDIRDFPEAMRDATPWRRDLAVQGIDDLAAIMEPGLSALLTARARGANAIAAAQALRREFQAARDALLMLAPPPEH